MKKRTAIIVFALASLSLMILCKDSGTGPNTIQHGTSCDSLMLVSPVGGETFKVGSTYDINWCIPTNWQYTQVKISLSVANKHIANFKTLKSNAPASKLSYSWTVDSTQIGDSCRIQIKNYDETKGVESTSGYFKVNR
jgi:hypothetical protein